MIDASTAIAWCFEDESSRYADMVLDSLANEDAVAPAIWPLEIANALVVAERRSRLSPADVIRYVELISSLPIEVVHLPPARAFGSVLDVARGQRTSSYDAAYLDLAMHQGVALATTDRAMRRAAGRLGVALFK